MPDGQNDQPPPPLRVALVNNMPDAAVAVTERQFRTLIEAAAGRAIELLPFEIDGIARSEAIRARMASRYRPIEALEAAQPDLLVVTGADPGSKPLHEADFWPGFARLIDWAAERGQPTLWSCLAAHAAAWRLDAVPRQRLPEKLSGVYPCEPVGAGPLLAGLAGGWAFPHSHYNTLDGADLVRAGYPILARSKLSGVDSFIGRGGAPFLFLHGHPEYDHDSLALEFRRDFRALVHGERGDLPPVPAGLYAAEVEEALSALREEALRQPSPELLDRWPKSDGLAGAAPPWRAAGMRLCANWLAAVAPALRLARAR